MSLSATTFQFTFKWYHRKDGPTHTPVRESANTLPTALSRATRAFYKERTHKDKNDIKTMGLKVEVATIGKSKESTNEDRNGDGEA